MTMATDRQAAVDTLGVHVGILDAIGIDERRWTRLVDQVDADRSVTKRDTQETVTAARQLASAARKLDRKAQVAFSFWRRDQRQADRDEYLEATSQARQVLAALAELLCHDEALIAEVMRQAGR